MGEGRTARLTSADAGLRTTTPAFWTARSASTPRWSWPPKTTTASGATSACARPTAPCWWPLGARAAMARPDVEGRLDVVLAGSAPAGALGDWIEVVGARTGRLIGPADGWPRSLPPLARALAGRSTALVLLRRRSPRLRPHRRDRGAAGRRRGHRPPGRREHGRGRGRAGRDGHRARGDPPALRDGVRRRQPDERLHAAVGVPGPRPPCRGDGGAPVRRRADRGDGRWSSSAPAATW